MADLSTTIRLFLSSTFVDLGRERQVLQRYVFPTLRQQCAEQGFRFQPIDLRWGVTEAAGAERQTLRICFDELARCQRLSPDLFQLILLGERYGTCFLPEQIPATQVARLWPHLDANAHATFQRLYARDENAVPAEYLAVRAEGLFPEAEDDLRLALAQAGRAADFTEAELLPLIASATQREIYQGLFGPHPGDPRGVLAAIRRFAPAPSGPLAEQYVEPAGVRQAQQRALQASVTAALPAGQILRYSVPWRQAGSSPNVEARADAAENAAMATQFLTFLAPRLQAVMAVRKRDLRRLDLVAQANAAFAAQRAEQVVGREAELAQLADYLADDSPLPFIVTGAPGSGKSTLLAEVTKRLVTSAPQAVVLTRYIGITHGASSLADLLGGLRGEIASHYDQPAPEPLVDLPQLIAAFAHQLGTLSIPASRPLVLLLDALDQLAAEPQRIDWLPRQLAPHVRVVVSALPDRQELGALRAWVPEEQVLTVGPLGRENGQQVLRHWLAEDGRTLTAAQEAVVLNAFVAADGSPLYLRVAAEVARRWRSDMPASTLPATTTAVLAERLDTLEAPAQFGEILVRHALGDLAAARNGLAEDELLDILASDAQVRDALHVLAPRSPKIAEDLPLPVVLWARLYVELERLLTEREADGTRLLTFYHGQVRQVVEQRCLQGRDAQARHQNLATFFERQAWQPAVGVWNQRKLAELVPQQAGARATDPLQETLTDARYLEGKLRVEGANAALGDLAWLRSELAVRHITWVVSGWAPFLERYPEEVAHQVEGRRTGEEILHHAPWQQGHPALRLQHPTLPGDPALLRQFGGHSKPVNACTFSADGARALSASGDNTLRLWDVASGAELRRLEGHYAAVYACALSADDRFALSASEDGTLRLWDVASGAELRRFEGHSNRVTKCALSADGTRALSASRDRTLRLWDVASGVELRRLVGYRGRVRACSLNADGTRALSAHGRGIVEFLHDPTLRLWDTTSGRVLRRFKGHSDDVSSCALSADGTRALSGSADTTLRLWDTTSGAELRRFEGHTRTVTACTLSADGTRVLSGSADWTLRLWEVASGKELRRLEGHTFSVWGCALSADGTRALSASGDSTLRLWDVASETGPRRLEGHIYTVRGCALGADGALALSAADVAPGFSGSVDDTLRLWDTSSGQVLRRFKGHTRGIIGCALSADGTRALSGSFDNTLRLWDTSSGQELRRFKGHADWVRGCALNANGARAFSGSKDQTLRLWDTASGKELRRFEGHTSAVWGCALSADEALALSASADNTLRLWDVASGQVLRRFKGHTDDVWGCALSADGTRALSASADTTLRLWDTSSGQELRRFKGHTDTIRGCALSADGRLALSASKDRTLRLWDTGGRDGKLAHRVEVLVLRVHIRRPTRGGG